MRFKLILSVCLITACIGSSLFGQHFSGPVAPRVDEPEKKQETSEKRENLQSLPVSISFASGEKLKGFMHPESSFFSVEAGDSVLGDRQTFQWSELSSISILMWKRTQKGKGEYLFRVSSALVETKDGVLRCGSLPEKIDFTDSLGKKRVFFTCFYDYKKNGKWANSGSSDDGYPSTHPHPNTIVYIRFEKPAAPMDIFKFPF